MWDWLLVLTSRVRAAFSRRRLDEDFEHELQAHLAMLADEQMRRGLSREDAERDARLRLGGVRQLHEAHVEQRGLPWLDTAWQDVRYAVRVLRRAPAFTSVAVMTLAIGIGAGTAIFSMVHAVLLRPLPYQRPAELVRIFETNPLKRWTRNVASAANYADWKRRNAVFTDIAAYEQFNSVGSGAGDMFLTGFGEPQGLKVLGVTGNLFHVLAAQPLMGRTFTDDETYDGHARVVVLSYGVWRSVFGGDPAIVGKTITLSSRAFEVVGVMPPAFFFPGRDVQIWRPVGYPPSVFTAARRPHWLAVVARRRPGVSLERAQQEMNAIASQLEQQYPDTNTKMGVRLENLHDSFAFEPRPALLMLGAAAGVLFLIVCANIANLQLGRGVSRVRELAIRRALGAGRTRLVRQLLTEAGVVSILGGLAGLGLAVAVHAVLQRFAASVVPLFADVRIDRSVLAFNALLSCLAPLAFGALPALTSSKSERLGERSETASREARLLRRVLVAGEVALSIVLLVGAVLLLRSLERLQAVDPGFNQAHVVTFTINLPSARYPDGAQGVRAFEEIERRLRTVPGVQSVGASSTLALRGYTWTGDATVEGRSAGDYERELRHVTITPGYFATMGIRMLAGRPFEETDTGDQPQVVVVNEALAKQYFRGADAVGKRFTFGRPTDKDPWVTVVGVVANEKQDGMDKAAEPEAYAALRQAPQNPLTFVVRSSLDAGAVIAAARDQVRTVDRDLALTEVTTLEAVVDESLGYRRFQTTLLSAFAAVAALLAGLGIYGVLAYFVSQRSREIGIRLALGARPAALVRLVLGQGLLPVGVGVVSGVLAALALTSLMQTLLFGIDAIDPPTYGVALLLLASIATAACALPAMRATRVDPLAALRED